MHFLVSTFLVGDVFLVDYAITGLTVTISVCVMIDLSGDIIVDDPATDDSTLTAFLIVSFLLSKERFGLLSSI